MGVDYFPLKGELIQSASIEENRLGFEPEIVAKIARTGARIYGVAISYHGLAYAEGKKIDWKDGISAIRCILKYGLLEQFPLEAGRSSCEEERTSGCGSVW